MQTDQQAMSVTEQCDMAKELAIGAGLLIPAALLSTVLTLHITGVHTITVPPDWLCSPEWCSWLFISALAGLGTVFATETIARVWLRALFAKTSQDDASAYQKLPLFKR